MAKFRVFTPLSELLDRDAQTLAEISQTFSRYDIVEVLGVLQRMETLLWDAGAADTDVQDMIGVGLFGRETWAGIVGTVLRRSLEHPLGQRRPVFWFPQLVLNAAKVAFLSCPSTPIGQRPLAPLGTAILGLADHLGGENPDSRTLGMDVTINGAFNSHELPLVLFSLAERLYLQSHEHLRHSKQWVDVPNLLKDATGLPPERFMAIAAAVTAYWQTRDRTLFYRGAPDLRISRYLAATGIKDEEIASFLRVTARPLDEMRREVGQRYSLEDLRPFDFTPFAETPLVGDASSCLCLSFKLWLRRVTSDLHYFFVRHLNESDRVRYFNFMGIAFESICHDIFRLSCRRPRRAKHAPPLMRYFEIDRQSRNDCDLRADGVLLWRDNAIVIDAKSGRLPAAAMGGDVDVFEEFLERRLVAAAKQLDATVERLQNGEFGSIPSRIVPLVIGSQGLGWNPIVATSIHARISGAGLLRQEGVLPLCYTELEPLYFMKPVARQIGSAILDWASDESRSAFPFQWEVSSRFSSDPWSLRMFRRETQRQFDQAGSILKQV